MYEILKEIRSILETKEIESAAHRYELAVEDLIWSQACRACEERGGYLATLTSREEFERVQAQNLAEEQTAVMFFVGACRGEKSGFSWLESGTEQEIYEMLSLYKALFRGFWLEGEPGYTGLTEDGEEVREDCVAVIYRSSDGRCYLNDMPDDILSAFPSYTGKTGYICEYDE